MKTQDTRSWYIRSGETTLLEMLSAVVAPVPGKGNQGADLQGEAGSLCYSRTGTAKPHQFSLTDNQGINVQVISVLPNSKG